MAGVKGRSGRRSTREEFADLKAAERIFFEEQDQDKLENKIRTGRFSIKDRFVLNAMEGDTATVLKAYQKAVPDNLDVTSGGKPLVIAFDPTFKNETPD